jgi:hypothetical protein
MKVHESALEILYQKYSSKMMVVCSRYTSDEESAQEIITRWIYKSLRKLI